MVETGFVPTSAQLHGVSMCFVRCLAPNRSVKELVVELSLRISIDIGIPKFWYVDSRTVHFDFFTTA